MKDIDKNNKKRQALFSTLLVTTALICAGCSQDYRTTGFQSQIVAGEQFISVGQYAQGYSVLEQVTKDNPRSAEAQIALGDSYLRQGAHLKAMASYDTAIRLGAKTAGKVGKGRVHLANNRSELASQEFKAVLSADPNNFEAKNGIAVALDLDGDHLNAQNIYRELLDAYPTSAKVRNNYALSLSMSGKTREAIRHFGELSLSNLENEKFRQNLVLAYQIEGHEQEARSTSLIDLNEAQTESNLELYKMIRDRGQK
ncbi:tetratricopeptide repeat protein [Ruegeria sp. SCPT10]|uniref:tetratricopeptide repeat protein n=1 Tax=Ruegeria sp. SCP10 TaxID=3141377 RepID=UPI0033380965